MKSKKFIFTDARYGYHCIAVGGCGKRLRKRKKSRIPSRPPPSLRSHLNRSRSRKPDPKTTPEYHFTEAVQERGVLTVGVSGTGLENLLCHTG